MPAPSSSAASWPDRYYGGAPVERPQLRMHFWEIAPVKRYVLFRVNGQTEGMTIDFAPTVEDMRQALAARCIGATKVTYNGQAAVLVFDMEAEAQQRPVNFRSSFFLPVEIRGDFAIVLGFHFDEVLHGGNQGDRRGDQTPTGSSA